jgi:hypothetical protein
MEFFRILPRAEPTAVPPRPIQPEPLVDRLDTPPPPPYKAASHARNVYIAGMLERWAISSAGEHTLHTGGVVGSIPTSPTISLQRTQ